MTAEEYVARAIYAACEGYVTGVPWDETTTWRRAKAQRQAAAALAAAEEHSITTCYGAWAEGYGAGRDDEAAGLPLRPNPYAKGED